MDIFIRSAKLKFHQISSWYPRRNHPYNFVNIDEVVLITFEPQTFVNEEAWNLKNSSRHEVISGHEIIMVLLLLLLEILVTQLVG